MVVRNDWTVEWYIENQFTGEVKRQHKKKWQDEKKGPEVQIRCDLVALLTK